jgi:hypothetical protein
MASRRFTVDLAKKKDFINIFLLMPETGVNDAMRKAKFTEKDIADLQMRVQRAPYWYTLSVEKTIVEVRYVLQTGVQMQEISGVNKLPRACNRMEATRQRALKVRSLDHDTIMEEASRRDQLEYDDDEDDEDNESEEESDEESEEESDEESYEESDEESE